jgi:hypothetical protein
VVKQGGHDHDEGEGVVVDAGKSPPPADSVDVRDNTRLGMLKPTLGADSYNWEYLGVPGESTFADYGSEPVFRYRRSGNRSWPAGVTTSDPLA